MASHALFLLQIVLHPQWGSSVYPATIFAKAPLAAVQAAIAGAEAALAGEPGAAAAAD